MIFISPKRLILLGARGIYRPSPSRSITQSVVNPFNSSGFLPPDPVSHFSLSLRTFLVLPMHHHSLFTCVSCAHSFDIGRLILLSASVGAASPKCAHLPYSSLRVRTFARAGNNVERNSDNKHRRHQLVRTLDWVTQKARFSEMWSWYSPEGKLARVIIIWLAKKYKLKVRENSGDSGLCVVYPSHTTNKVTSSLEIWKSATTMQEYGKKGFKLVNVHWFHWQIKNINMKKIWN